ncbi:hypothetical protein RFI_10798 [Reticulomyxa filosa]|uniref:Endonuclease/exonuclease/phosphatase domain-containing protein n=1 Tax=Reticulomyxa filosa TaxID=46433 RepID=X6NKA0_RETFI|nr:hypothetical protein RFI_10798 [Reticulomyxa filosa]|eukprot:ETO26338.1 hypothetical protein RFI_10798 [Reticulomyxa filosa]
MKRTFFGIVGVFGCGLAVLHQRFGLSWRKNDLYFLKKSEKEYSPTLVEAQNHPNSHSNNAVKILCQNTWLSYFAGGPEREARRYPDIVCLQELFLFGVGPFWIMTSEFESIYNHLVNHLGYTYTTNPYQTLPLFGQNNGLMIFSKIPLDNLANRSFALNTRRLFTQKGLLATRVCVGDNNILLINTHLEHRNNRYKLGQIQQIKEEVQELLKKFPAMQRYQCILGDFNICSNYTFEKNELHRSPSEAWSLHNFWERLTTGEKHKENGHEEVKFLYDKLVRTMANELYLPHDVFIEKKCVDRTYRVQSGNSVETEACYDHVFMNDTLFDCVKDLQVVDYQENGLAMSDHFGLMVTLHL